MNNLLNEKYLIKQENFGIKKMKTASGENALHFELIGKYFSNIIIQMT
jgi:hypothetical protein